MVDIYLAHVRDGGKRKLIESKRHANLREQTVYSLGRTTIISWQEWTCMYLAYNFAYN